jgi:hypothetical protein
MFHPQNAAIALRVRFDIHVAKQAEECDPQDKQDRVPDEDEGDARCEGDEVEQRGNGGQGGGYFCIDLEHSVISLWFIVGRDGRGIGRTEPAEEGGGMRTHFPSLYLPCWSAACRSTP